MAYHCVGMSSYTQCAHSLHSFTHAHTSLSHTLLIHRIQAHFSSMRAHHEYTQKRMLLVYIRTSLKRTLK